jgi:hypothetical protein
VRGTQFFGERRKKVFSTLKAPKLCQLVLLVEVSLREGKALGNLRESTGKK